MLKSHNKKKWWRIEVAGYGEHSCYQLLFCVSINVIFKRKVLFFNIYYKFTQRSRFYGSPNSVGWNHSARMVFQKFVPYHSWSNQHPRRSQDKLFLGKYFEKLIFSMHSCATSFNSNLTQGSIIKMDNFLPKYANNDVYFKPVNSLWGYANSRMSKYMVRCLFNSNKLLRLLA